MIKSEIIISTDKEKLDIDYIHGFLTTSYWAEGIPKHTVAKSITNSFCFGMYEKDRQIGFARVITDFTTFAYLADVFILPDHQGQGLAKRLLKEVISHPELQGLRRMSLATHDAHSLYEKFGFKPLSHPEIFMELWDPNVYTP